MDIILKFCYTKNPELLNNLPYHIKQFFIEASKYSIKHKKGRQDIAKIVINQPNIKGDVVSTIWKRKRKANSSTRF